MSTCSDYNKPRDASLSAGPTYNGVNIALFCEVIVSSRKLVSIFCLHFLLVSPVSWGEGVGGGVSSPQKPGTTHNESDIDAEQREKMIKDMTKQANKQRQEDLKEDTVKLLELATELKQYVDKTNENVMSLEVMKKAEQIEKLAHSVREKMKAN
ncbi:MAG TPA: hypothetical protein VH437_22885 [Terriglobales bacterium]|jgi:hypothetical protein